MTLSRIRNLEVVTLVLIALAIILVFVSCTEITTYYPICEVTHIDTVTNTTWVDTMAVPDSACIAEFLEITGGG